MSQSQEDFQREIDRWCSGIRMYPGAVTPGTIYQAVEDIGGLIRRAFNAGFEIDLFEIARRISGTRQELLSSDDLVKALVKELPNPKKLTEDELYRLANVLDCVERRNPDLLVNLIAN